MLIQRKVTERTWRKWSVWRYLGNSSC